LFSISTLVDVVRIPPSLFGTTLKKAAVNILKEKYESMINAELGYIIMILDAKVDEIIDNYNEKDLNEKVLGIHQELSI